MSKPLTILVATDLSLPSVQAAETAVQLASTLGATLHVVHVVEQIGAYGNMRFPPDVPPTMMRTLVDDARARLSRFVQEHLQGLPEAQQHLRAGRSWEEILVAAEDSGADLLVVGSHGRSWLDRMALGSVAERLIGASPIPVLALRRMPRLGEGTRFLVATDLSESSELAARMAWRLAHALGGRLEVLGVMESRGGAWFHGRRLGADQAQAEQLLRMQLTEFATRCWPDIQPPPAVSVRGGTPWHEIAEAATANADVLVMGATGQSRAMEWLLGSVAQRVLRSTPVAILSARAATPEINA